MKNAICLAASLALAVLAALPAATPAQAFSGGIFPSCDSPSVLNYIGRRFDWQAKNFHHRDLAIVDFHNVHQNRIVHQSETRQIERRYCHARAVMSDGRKRTIWYLIEAGMGFASIRDNVEFCIAGLDRWHVYGAYCRSVR